MGEHHIALEAYELLAERYAAMIDTKPHNAYYERPATLSLLPDVDGRRALDAGCGPGVYAEWLVDHGAEVVALDTSPKMVHLARQRLRGRAKVVNADLGRPLGFLVDSSFDVVLSTLALDYVDDWRPVMGEFYRVLRRPGWLVCSVGHPFADMLLHPDGKYREVELVHWVWKGFGIPVRMPSYRRPLQEVFNPMIEAGFVLDRVLEPLPTEQFREADPDGYEELCSKPGFLCLRLIKR